MCICSKRGVYFRFKGRVENSTIPDRYDDHTITRDQVSDKMTIFDELFHAE